MPRLTGWSQKHAGFGPLEMLKIELKNVLSSVSTKSFIIAATARFFILHPVLICFWTRGKPVIEYVKALGSQLISK